MDTFHTLILLSLIAVFGSSNFREPNTKPLKILSN